MSRRPAVNRGYLSTPLEPMERLPSQNLTARSIFPAERSVSRAFDLGLFPDLMSMPTRSLPRYVRKSTSVDLLR